MVVEHEYLAIANEAKVHEFMDHVEYEFIPTDTYHWGEPTDDDLLDIEMDLDFTYLE